MSVDDLLAVCHGLDAKRWVASPGFDLYPPNDPCDRRIIVWNRPESYGWRAEVEYRDAFSWEHESTQLLGSPEELDALIWETFAVDLMVRKAAGT
jgi:hypothetical protein